MPTTAYDLAAYFTKADRLADRHRLGPAARRELGDGLRDCDSADQADEFLAAVGRVLKAFDPAEHPRDDRGRFLPKSQIDAARRDPRKAAELRSRVTDPGERAKLDAHLAREPVRVGPHHFPADHELASGEATHLKPGGEVRKVTAPGANKPVVVKQRHDTGQTGPLEVLASRLAETAGVAMPDAAMTTVGGRPAVVQEFAKGKTLAKLREDGPDAARAAMGKVPKEEIDRHVLFDYLIGHSDVHLGNTMIDDAGRLTAIDREFVLSKGIRGQRFEPPQLLNLARPDGNGLAHAFDPETVREMADAGRDMAAELERDGMHRAAREVRDRAVVLDKLARDHPRPTAGDLWSLSRRGVTPPDLGFLKRLFWHLTKGD